MTAIRTKMKQFIDIGANLTDLMYKGIYNGSKKHEEDLQHVLARSWQVGLCKMIITGGNLEESKAALDIAAEDERLFTTVGCHPTRCQEFENNTTPQEYYDNLSNVIRNNLNKVVAVGECGLDYDRVQFCPIDIQKKYFEMQLKLSEEYKLPLFLHCRNAATDLYDILAKYQHQGVVHSFDGSFDDAKRFIDLGYYIGLNGCSLKTNENLECVAQIPADKILIETDCPWCEIRPSHAGYKFINKEHFIASVKKEKWDVNSQVKSRNEPANIQHVLDVIAAVKKENPDVLMNVIYKNTTSLFFNNKC